jgi:WD40 repeat protein
MPATELKGHAALVYSLSFHPDSGAPAERVVLATASFDSTVKLWDFAEGKELRTLSGHTGPVYGVAFAPDGNTLASCSEDKTIRFWDPAAGKEVKSLGSHGGTVYSVAFATDGKLLASAGADGLVKVWDVPGQKELKALKGHEGAVSAVLFTPAGLASAGFDRTLRLWDVDEGKEKEKLGLPDDPYGLALSADGQRVAVAGYAGHLTVWLWEQSKPTFTHKGKSPAYCVRFTPDGKALVSGHDDGVVRVTPLG